MTLKAFSILLAEQAELARIHQQWCETCDEEGDPEYARKRRAEAYADLCEVDEQIAIALEAERAAEATANDAEKASA